MFSQAVIGVPIKKTALTNLSQSISDPRREARPSEGLPLLRERKVTCRIQIKEGEPESWVRSEMSGGQIEMIMHP